MTESLLQAYTRYFKKCFRPAAILILGLLGVLVIGYIDYITGYQIGFFLFYIIPIAITTWLGGLYPGIIISFASIITWFLADSLAGVTYPNYFIPGWNAAIRLTVFLIITYALWYIRILNRRSKELTEFVANDLYIHLDNISQNLNKLLENENQALSSQQKDIVDAYKISTDMMSALIDSILDISRLENRKIKLILREINLEELLNNALRVVSVFAKNRQIKLEKCFNTQQNIFYTDFHLIRCILINLLNNAIKVSSAGSPVSVVVDSEDDRKIKISVIDRGPGIPKNIIDSFFDRFAQIKARESGLILFGSGLGLTFCKLAVEELGGRIWVESEESKGTAVRVVLPVGNK
ncbi:MAG: HAMP domain-containing sensor histidine kinase [Candidatus Omnitrophota bacterium]|nr:HAMP domain-containing sensor histidine kinase [Candidatus Omnitrophota bacterium]